MLKKILRASLCAAFICNYPLNSFSQKVSDTLDGVTITSNRLQSRLGRMAQSVSTISQKDIKALPGKVPADWLATVSGVDVRQRGPVGVQADIGIRGGSFDQSLVLLNGMKLSDPQTGHHVFNLPFTPEAIRQVDVIKTAASRIYGINALTGAINFVTKVPDSNMIYAGAFGGDFGLYGFNAGAALHAKNTAQHISYSEAHSDGYTTNTDFTTRQMFYQATITGKAGELNATGGYTSRDFGARGFYVANSSEYERIQTAFGGLSYDVRFGRLKIKAQTYYRYNQDEYIYLRANPAFFRNRHFSHVIGGEIHATYDWALGLTGIGAELRNEDLVSNNLGKRNRTINGIFAEHRFAFLGNRLNITPGVYLNKYTGNDVTAFPGIDASLAVKPGVLVFASADKGMRLPTYTDLYYNGPSNTGNPSLKPEEAVSTEAGVKLSKGMFFLTVAGFNRYSSNLIDWARENDTQKWQPLNINHVNFSGVETGTRMVLNTWLQQVSAGYTFIRSDIRQTENYISRYTLSNIKHQATGEIRFRWFRPVLHSISIRHVNRVNMPDYTLVDTRLACNLKSLTVYADVMNVFDTRYMEAGYVTMPGRWFKVGIDLKVNFRRF
jgi:vitamin B12 transporter